MTVWLLSVGALTSAQTVTFNEYPAGGGSSQTWGIAPGPDGALWFTQQGQTTSIGRITIGGSITTFTIPTTNAGPSAIAAGPDGALWFLENANKVGRITTAGVVTNEYVIPTSGSGPYRIAAGSDGALWFTETFANQIGRITTAGAFNEYPIPTANSGPTDIAAGPDGALWFTEESSNKIGRITTAGVITNEYLVPTASAGPFGIIAGPDGALWFTEDGSGNKIGRITIGGTFTEYAVPTGDSAPGFITTGVDGAVWFSEILGTKVGRITTGGTITEYSPPTSGSEPFSIVSGPDGALWFTELTSDKIARAFPAFPVLGVTKSHTGNFAQGQANATYTVNVSNTGSGSTNGLVTVVDTLPAGLSLALMSGSGWSCSFNSCTRSDVLASGQAYPAITVAVNVAPNATSPAVNQVLVTGGGSNSANATDSTTIVPPIPSLSVTKAHTADFVQGQTNALYTVSVSNTGGPTTGAVTMTESIPTGLTLVSMSGSGWNCSSNTCTRSDVLPAASSYPNIVVGVNVASNAPSQVTNQVSVSGGGSAAANASDPTNINPPACSYSFSNSPASAGSGTSTGSAQLVTSLTNCPYTSVVSNNPDWIAIASGSSGSGSGAIGYSIISANNSGAPRAGTFTVFNTVSNVSLAIATFTINQAAASCSSLTLAPDNFTFGPAGGSGTVNFNTSPCAWSITGIPSWITTPSATGTVASFSFTVAANPSSGSSREATLSINNGALTVTIVQTGLVCTYTITDSAAGFGVSRSFPSSGGSGGINVAAPTGCGWVATTSQPFITITGNVSGNGNGGVTYSVAANSSSANVQTGTITIVGLAYVITEQPVGSAGYSCSASSLGPAPIRPEGFAEKVADIVVTCGGQAPSGGLTGDILVSFNTGVTNLLLSTAQTDALLLEDEPTPASLALGTNAFRGILSPVNGVAAILFPSVQLAVGGGTFLHTWRITNARVNAQTLAAGRAVQATVSITANAPFTVTGQPSVATVSSASAFTTGTAAAGSAGQTVQPVSFTEGFATAFGPRLLTGQDPSQAGTVNNSESGYVNSAALGSQTGFATNGTRLIVSIANVPAGVSVYAPAAPASGTNAQIVSADATGTGGFAVSGTSEFNGILYQRITLAGGAGTTTWEVTASDSTKIETLTFNLLLVNSGNASLAGITYAGALAPVSAGAAPQLPSKTLPVPRFASGAVPATPPATVSLSVSPQAGGAQGQAQAEVLKPALRSAAAPSSSAVGGTVTWTQVQANNTAAAGSTAPNVSVGGTLPPTWVITGCTAMDSAGVCPTLDPNNPGNSYTVSYPSLSPGQTGTIVLTAQSSNQSSGAVEYTSSINSDLANTDSTASSFTTNFPVSEIGLNVSLTNASNFSQRQIGAQYSVTLSNGGSLPTSLPVTVTEMLPASLTLVSMTGMGWTCTLSTSSCTRSDVLAGNSSFPAITVTVNVSAAAPVSVTNQVAAMTGVLQATGSDVTNISPAASTSVTNVTSSTANGTYGAGSTISIQAAFSGAVTVTGTPQLALNSGGTASYSSGSGAATLTFTYTVGGSDSSTHLDYASTGALTLNGGTIKDTASNNASLTLPAPGAAGSLGTNTSIAIATTASSPVFFDGAVSLASGVYYLQYPNGTAFGYYNLQYFPILYHYDMGFEAFIDAHDASSGAFLYDFSSGHWFYTSPSLFPYLYDFTLNNWLYYFPDTKNPGHSTSNPRYFSNLTTGKIFTM